MRRAIIAASKRIFMCFSTAQFAIVIGIWHKLIARTLKGNKFNREKCALLMTFRFMWFCIHTFDACALIYFTLTIWGDFTANPLVTTLHDTIYPIENIPFPAVTVCSNNRISRRAAEEFAKEL